MGQIISSISGEKFVASSPETRSYSSYGCDYENVADIRTVLLPQKKGDGEQNAIFQSRESVFRIRLETAAKQVVEEASRNYESITEKNEIVEDDDDSSDWCSLGNEEKSVAFQSSSRGTIAEKGNENPLLVQKNKQRRKDGDHKDVAIKKRRRKKKKNIVEDNSKNGDKEKPVIFPSSKGPILFQDPAAKGGNENPLADTKNKQRIEDGHHEDVAIKKTKRIRRRKTSLLKTVARMEEKKRLIFQSSRGPVLFKAHIDPAAQKGNENPLAHQKNKQRKEDSHHKAVAIKKKQKSIVEDNSKNGDKEKTVKFQSSRGPVLFRAHIDHATKKGNENPLAQQKNKQRIEYGHFKDVRIKKNRKKKSNIVEDNSKNGDKEKTVKFQSSRGPVLFRAPIDPAAKKGNENPPAHQKNKQKIEYGHLKDVRIKKNRKKESNIVEDNSKNREKEKSVIFPSSRGPILFKAPIDPAAKKGYENPLAHQKNKQMIEYGHHKDGAIKKNRKKKKSNIVEDNSKNGDKEKPMIFQSSRGPVLFKAPNDQINETGHHKDGAINKALIVQEEKHVIFQSLREPAAEKVNINKPLADFSNKHIKETNHHKKSIGLDDNEIVWLKHYNNKQKILMVGEGDFSFSASLAVAFGSSASNITATSFNNSDYLRCNYKNATENIKKLTNRGATVRHGVDATKMSNYWYWKDIKFDRIIYNFPFSGCPKSESHQTRMREHLELVSGFLLNAKEMLEEGGQIHISHKTNKIHLDWNLKELAMSEGLLLVEEAKFNKGDYPGYETKQGYICDKNFPCNPSSTYMFVSIPN